MSLGVNIEKAVRHGLELMARELLVDSEKLTPISTGTLRLSNKYEFASDTVVNMISGAGYNHLAQQSISEYAETMYFGAQYRHAGDFQSGLKSIIDRYAGQIAKDGTWRERYAMAWKLADQDGYLVRQPEGAPRWFERAYFNNKRKLNKIFASAFRPGAYR